MIDGLDTALYSCQSPQRRRLVQESGTHNGIDHLEVDPTQRILLVHFLADLPGTGPDAIPAGPPIQASNLVVAGGARVVDPEVVAVAAAGSVLQVEVAEPGDFSWYELRLVTSEASQDPLPGFDPRLSSVAFTFKANCPSPFDCGHEPPCPVDEATPIEIDYLSKDYESFRRLMLDRMATLLPAWDQANPADPAVAIVEALAHIGDRLSYQQDAVATEAYLATARHRISVRRHARLLDYRMHDGSNARTWAVVSVGSPMTLPAGTPILSRGGNGDGGAMVASTSLADVLASENPIVFETMTEVDLAPGRHEIGFYAWGDEECCLPAGSTRATLAGDPALGLAVGDVLILEEIRDPDTGLAADADPSNRHPVRLVEVVDRDGGGDPLVDPVTGIPIVEVAWSADDALPFSLCLSARFVGPGGGEVVAPVAVARANVVACDHGRTVTDLGLRPDRVPADGSYRPVVDTVELTRAAPVDSTGPAALLTRAAPAPAPAEPAIELLDDRDQRWRWEPDLLGASRFAPSFTVETDDRGAPNIRFGDGANGRRPTQETRFLAVGRIGNGAAGNVGPETLGRMVIDGGDVRAVRNPLPAVGGSDQESMQEVRIKAPQAFRRQERAVTAADYAEVTERHADVQRAVAEFRWTGSWHTVFVTVDRLGGRPVDDEFRRLLVEHLETYRLAGHDVEIRAPRFVGLDLAVDVCLVADAFRAEVRREILDRLSSRVLPDRRLGLFHPDRFVFGTPVYLSRIYQEVGSVAGVHSVAASRFHRFGRRPAGELDAGVVQPSGSEILRLDNDPNFPERGRVEIDLVGGR